jgi:hypothetical protein
MTVLIDTTVSHEPARALRHEQDRPPEDGGWYETDAEHPAPFAGRRERVVHQVGGDNSKGDHELVRRDEPAPLLGRGQLGDVEGDRHRRPAHPQADDEAPGNQERGRLSEHDDDDPDHEGDRDRKDRSPPPEPVRRRATGERTEHRTEQRARDHGALLEGGQAAEVVADVEQCTRDNAGVETEQKATDGGDGADRQQEAVSPIAAHLLTPASDSLARASCSAARSRCP